MKIITIPEYEKKVPFVSEKDYLKLKNDIDKRGLDNAVTVNQDGILLDGHHRFRACMELRKECRYVVKEFKNKLDELEFVIKSNLLRRQLTDGQKIALYMELEKIESERATIRQKQLAGTRPNTNPTLVQNSTKVEEKGKAAEIILKDSDISVRKYYSGKNIIKKGTPQQVARLMQGESVGKIEKEIIKTTAKQKILAQSLPKSDTDWPKLFQGDFMEQSKKILSDSIDLIFTDPPYDRKSLPLYQQLGELAQRVLKPNGSLVTFIGNYELPTILDFLRKSKLEYWWQFCVKHSGGHAHMKQRFVYVHWKPLLWFVKGTLNEGVDSIDDFIQSKPPEKMLHPWQQSTVEAEHIIEKLTIGQNQIVFDPFMGSGTTGIATVKLKRKFIGIEKDKEMFEIARREIGQV